MHYHFRHKAQGTRHKHWQTYVLSLSNNLIRRVFTRNLFISSKLFLNELSKLSLKSPKSPKTALLVSALLLLSLSWNVQANGKKARAGNRSDAIMLQPSPVINYVRPCLHWGRVNYNHDFRGPADIWNPDKGFLVQSTNPESYNLNFPTTGMNGLYFDLLISGVDINELTWEPVTHEGITATVTNVVPNNTEHWIPDEDKGQVVARVKLTGPRQRYWWENPSHNSNSSPSQITVPSLPQTFELVGRDRSGNEVMYGFVLRQWFVYRDSWEDVYSNQTTWCNSFGYRMPRIRDLTNAKCGVENYRFPCINGIDSATPSSSGNHYQRNIGAGLFSEWGVMMYYADIASLHDTDNWTSDAAGRAPFVVNLVGMVDLSTPIHTNQVFCTAP
ncbi:hypothetical protein [Gilliamella sp. Occ4-3]|uniref:hypothetical protein n=1 Tax=Gilliamella sp. Occ4-3 TaxID=3120254 RepID=UPI00080E9EA1|nr:hypothetical protein [Gilliamella apicola]OCG78933.1 hypothetical protein A9G44_12805 [Gilliamella apicola]